MRKVQEPTESTLDESPKRSAWQWIQIIFNTINHVLIIVVTVYMTFFTYNSVKYEVDKQLKIWHAYLCTIGVSYYIEISPSNVDENGVFCAHFSINF